MDFAIQNIINGRKGSWLPFGNHLIFTSSDSKVIYPSYLDDIEVIHLNKNSIKNIDINLKILSLIKIIVIGNVSGLSSLQRYLVNILNLFSLNELFATRNQIEEMENFLQNFKTIDLNDKIYLDTYYNQYKKYIRDIMTLLNQDIQKEEDNLKIEKQNFFNEIIQQKSNFKVGKQLIMKDANELSTIQPTWNANGIHQKLYVEHNQNIFLVDGYEENAIACVNRVLVSQLINFFELNGEEVYFSNYHGKLVNLTKVVPAVSLMENWTYEFYPLDKKNYIRESQEKRALYFLVQNTHAYIQKSLKWKERFSEHFIDTFGHVFICNNAHSSFLTSKNLGDNVLTLEITKENYPTLKKKFLTHQKQDIAEIIFSSIPFEYVQLHDKDAKKFNKPTFLEKKINFDKNWHIFLECIYEFKGSVLS